MHAGVRFITVRPLRNGMEIYLEITAFTGNVKKALGDRNFDANSADDPA